MLSIPNMLMIGSAGRNVGKTELACSIIRRFSAVRPVTGIKVTTITHRDGTCPRGGKGCGVCSSLTGKYCITEERGDMPGKDTARLLAAGADRVFWLRVMKSHLREGLDELLATIGPHAVSVVESNSLRTVLQPGLFLMVRDKAKKDYKASAEAVREDADITLLFDGTAFDPTAAPINLTEYGWAWRHDATAIILAGGSSTRMKEDKSMLPIGEQPMIQHIHGQLEGNFIDTMISTATPDSYSFLGARTVCDTEPGRGPLMGIASALDTSSTELNFVTGCDIPDVYMPLVRRMLGAAEGYDAVVPRTGDGMLEPLFAVYRRRVVGTMLGMLETGSARVREVFNHCRTRYLDVPPQLIPRNLNTRQEYEAYITEKETQ